VSDQQQASNEQIQAAANAAAVDTKFAIKFNGQEIVYDLTKPEDKARLQADAQLGRFSERQTTKLNELKGQLEQFERDPDRALGRELRDWMARDPLAAGTVMETVKALQEGRLDPVTARARLLGQGGDADGAVAQTGAVGDAQTRAYLQRLEAELRSVKGRTEELASAQTMREREAAIRGTLSGEDWLRARPATMQLAERRTQELLSRGMGIEEATLLAVREARDIVNEAVNAQATKLRESKEDAPVKTSGGVPPIGDFVSKKVDPKAKPFEQKQQRRAALTELFNSFKRQALGDG